MSPPMFRESKPGRPSLSRRKDVDMIAENSVEPDVTSKTVLVMTLRSEGENSDSLMRMVVIMKFVT